MLFSFDACITEKVNVSFSQWRRIAKMIQTLLDLCIFVKLVHYSNVTWVFKIIRGVDNGDSDEYLDS